MKLMDEYLTSVPPPPAPETSPPSISPIRAKKTTDWKKILGVGVGMLVILGAGIGIGVVLENKLYQKPAAYVTASPTPAPTTDPTANWKTYTNNELGVNFKHPSDWVITETSIQVVLLKDPDIRTVIGACPGYSFSISKYDPYLNYSRFDKVAKSELNGESTETWTSEGSKCKEKVIFINALPSNDLKPKYIISFMSKNSDGDKIFDQILSTFKFLREDIVCDIGKSYENTAVNPVLCKCPGGYGFKTISTSFGPCPNPRMKDCRATTLECVKK